MYKIETFEQACEAITNQGLELADLYEENDKLKADIKEAYFEILNIPHSENGECFFCGCSIYKHEDECIALRAFRRINDKT